MKTETPDKSENLDFWLRLDNAAKIYPAIKDRELTSVFRVSVELKERIKARQLIEAVHTLGNRFPYYKVKLKTGFFWYYLQHDNIPINVSADQDKPCRAFNEKELMFRVLVRQNRMSVEFSHILTDGTGAFEFLKALLFAYFEKCNRNLSTTHNNTRVEEPVAEEYEDAYQRYFTKSMAPLIKQPQAFHLHFPLSRKPRFSVLTGIIPLDQIARKAKAYEVSVTEYLISIYFFVLQDIHNQMSGFEKKRSRKTIRIEVPVNLRRMYPSRTMRNFTLYVLPWIDLRLGYYSFEEIVKTVYHQMQLETDKKLINKMISRNVSGERNILLKNIPLFIKSLVLSKLYKSGTNQYSGVLTNLGKINFTPEVNQLIDRFVFIPPPPNRSLKINCGVVGFDNKLVISFGSITASKELERRFFTFITGHGIPVKIKAY